MRFAPAFVATFVALSIASNSGASAPPAAGASVSTIANGLQLTVTTGNRTYPLDALARVTVRAQNVSDHTITLAGTAGLPNGGLPLIWEVDVHGRAVYAPPKFRDYAIWPASPQRDIQLLPGEAIHRSLFIILWSDFLQAAVIVISPENQGVRSDSLAIHLVGAQPPDLDLRTSGGQVYAVVHRPKGVRGPLYYRSSERCQYKWAWTHHEQPDLATLRDAWGKTRATRFVPPPCPVLPPPQPASPTPQTPVPSGLTGWRLLVAWPDDSVAAISYGTPAP